MNGGAAAGTSGTMSGWMWMPVDPPTLARLFAFHPQPVPIDLHRMFWRELELIGARVYEREDFERAIDLIASGAVPADELITATVPLAETQSAFAALEDARALKVLIDVQN